MTFLKRGAALGLCMLSLGAAAPLCAEPFRFPWDPPEREPTQDSLRQSPQRRQVLTPSQVRSVLAGEGARLIGAPRRHGGVIVAVGRDRDGTRRKFTLDADGQVVDIEILETPEPAPREAPRRASDRQPELDGGRRLPPEPRHSLDGPDDLFGPAPVEPAPVEPSARPAKSGADAAPPPAPRKETDSADAALSPIKPLRSPGAPRIEPLPQ